MAYKSPFNLPDEHMRLVGIIAFHWEALDIGIQRAIADVSMHEFHRVSLLTSSLSFGAKVDFLTAYARPLKEDDPDTWREFTDLFRSLQDAYAKRNAYVHAKWIPDRPPIRLISSIKGGRLRIEELDTTIEELEEAAAFIHDVGENMILLFRRFGMLQA